MHHQARLDPNARHTFGPRSPRRGIERRAWMLLAAVPVAAAFGGAALARTPEVGRTGAGQRAAPDAALSTTQATHALEQVGQVGGASHAPVMVGKLVFVGIGPRLVAVDIADPAEPRVLGRSEPLGAVVRGVDVASGYAYVATQNDGRFHVVDVHDPSRPRTTASLYVGGTGLDVAADGEVAYVAAFNGQVRVVDIRDPARPEVVGNVVGTGWPRRLEVVGDRLYVADTKGLRILDIGHGGTPSVVGEIALGDTLAVDVAGDRAFVVGTDDLAVIDLRDPRTPRREATLAVEGGPVDVVVDRSTAYVATSTRGVAVVDVAEPATPRLVAEHRVGRGGRQLAVEAGIAVVAAQAGGIDVLDTTDPGMPSALGELRLLGELDSVRGQPGVGVVYGRAQRADLVWGVDARDLPAAAEAFHWTERDIGTNPFDIAVGAGQLYLMGDDLVIADVRDPSRPALGIGRLAIAGFVDAAAAVGRMVYAVVTDPDARAVELLAIDAGTATQPRVAGSAPIPGLGAAVIRRLVVAGGFAYVAAAGMPVLVVDVGDPARPRPVATLAVPDASDVDVRGGRAYVVSPTAGLHVFDVADPAAPAPVGVLDVEDQRRISVAPPLAFLGGTSDSITRDAVSVVDVADPSGPRRVGTHVTAGYVADLWADGDRVYVADLTGGLAVFRALAAATPIATASPPPATQPTPTGPAPLNHRVYVPDARTESDPGP